MNDKELEFICAEGEGQYIEFKEKPDRSLAGEMVAFANAGGGKIFIGITDEGEAAGFDATNREKSQVQDLANNCDPPLLIGLEQSGNVFIVEIKEGKNKPYKCREGFFIRIGPNAQKMSRDQILELCIKDGKIRFDEQVCADFDFKDFDDDKFDSYLKLAHISNTLDKKDILANIHVLTDKGMTNAGVLFFAKKPSEYIQSSIVRCLHFKDVERIDILDKKEIDKGIIGNIEFAINYIRERVPVEFKIVGSRREEYPEYHEEAYREAIVNAVVHRNYYEVGPDTSIEKLKDRIFINNPGGLLSSFPKEQFGKVSWPRNKLIADLLSRTIFMEKVGTGIKRIEAFCKDNGNHEKIYPEENYFFVEIYSNHGAGENVPLNVSLNVSLNVPLTDRQKKILGIISEERANVKLLAQRLKVAGKTITRDTDYLVKSSLIKRAGSKKTGYYVLKLPDKNEEDKIL